MLKAGGKVLHQVSYSSSVQLFFILCNYYSLLIFSVYLYAGKKKKGGKSPGRTPVKSPSKRPKTKNYVKKVYCYI